MNNFLQKYKRSDNRSSLLLHQPHLPPAQNSREYVQITLSPQRFTHNYVIISFTFVQAVFVNKDT